MSSQLAVTSGAWRYDHLLDAHLAGSPELVSSPLQHARARFDVYEMRLAYAPTGARYAAAIGRQPGAPLGELGTVDGGQARLVLNPQLDVTAFAGLRPASTLGLSLAPRAGADLGWHTARVDGTTARVDIGAVADAYKGSLDRAETAAAASLATRTLLVHADALVDLATDALGRGGASLTHAAGMVRAKRGRITASVQAGYDRPFMDRALVADLGLTGSDLTARLGPRTYAGGDASYALRAGFDLGGSARVSRGDGFTSAYADLVGTWYAPSRAWFATVAPHAVVGSLVDEFGVRASLDIPIARWSVGLGGSLDRVYAAGEQAWAGFGRISGGRSIYRRWRTSLALEVAAGDGPARVFAFGQLAYRLGK